MVGEFVQKNLPGYYGVRFPAIGSWLNGFHSEHHQNYNAEWFEEVIAGKLDNIIIHGRSMRPGVLSDSLADEDLPSALVAQGSARYTPTHHQKMVLIDYELPGQAVGYVMGHNSVTDFWDTAGHKYRDPLRETFFHDDPVVASKEAYKQGPALDGGAYLDSYQPSAADLESKDQAVTQYMERWKKKNAYVAKPYQDVSLRVRGPILYDINHNFCEAWSESMPASSAFIEQYWLATAAAAPLLHGVSRKLQKLLQHEKDEHFAERRKNLKSDAFWIKGSVHSAQLLRTQPMHGEKSIKECYANLTRLTHHYIFIQNQYIQYGAWATHLQNCVKNLRDGGFTKPIYVFILTSTPERDGMDLATYDVAQQLGQSATMKVEHEAAVAQARKGKQKMPLTPEELAIHGINVVMGSLWTCAQPKPRRDEYEEIYIHSKVTIVDDAAFTIGSANLNVRSMAIDGELNILSQAKDVAYDLRCELFTQCFGEAGPKQFEDMKETFNRWKKRMSDNARAIQSNGPLDGQIVAFHVDRKPGAPLI
jgi:phosphatidylserine/phosphatidylglycerophosphate/cardiolipin synthase-like enzyme